MHGTISGDEYLPIRSPFTTRMTQFSYCSTYSFLISQSLHEGNIQFFENVQLFPVNTLFRTDEVFVLLF